MRVVQINARRAGVIPFWCGRRMLVALQRQVPERRTCPCSRPLRARDRSHFDRVSGALAAADRQAVRPLYQSLSGYLPHENERNLGRSIM